MPAGDRRDANAPLNAGYEDGLLRERPNDPVRLGALAEELQQALYRVDALTRELGHVESAVRAQAEDVSRIHDTLQVLDGRTQRHEAGQEQAREVRQEIAELEERLAQETALRRDLQAQVDRLRGRDAEHQQELFRALQVIADRLDEIDGRDAAEAQRDDVRRREAQRQRSFEGEITDVAGGSDLVARLDALERRVAAEYEGSRHAGTEVARLSSAVTGLMSAVDSLEARARALTDDHHHLADDLAAFRAVESHEVDLREVVEQQRSIRGRLEERLAQAEGLLADLQRAVSEFPDRWSLLQQQIAGEVEQRRALENRVEGQRDTFIEHMRRQALAQEESHRRLMRDMEREIRISRQLLVRLSEDTSETDTEQPL